MCLVTPFSHCVVMLVYSAYQSNNLVIVIFLFVKYRWDVFKRLFLFVGNKRYVLKRNVSQDGFGLLIKCPGPVPHVSH
jgi:hypothetical protein